MAAGYDDVKNLVSYADGINPDLDDFDVWWENKRSTFGPDDGVEYFDVEGVEEWIMGKEPKIKITPKSVSLVNSL
jgi:hypothetical protein